MFAASVLLTTAPELSRLSMLWTPVMVEFNVKVIAVRLPCAAGNLLRATDLLQLVTESGICAEWLTVSAAAYGTTAESTPRIANAITIFLWLCTEQNVTNNAPERKCSAAGSWSLHCPAMTVGFPASSSQAHVAQLARASPCQGEGRGFEPRHALQSSWGGHLAVSLPRTHPSFQRCRSSAGSWRSHPALRDKLLKTYCCSFSLRKKSAVSSLALSLPFTVSLNRTSSDPSYNSQHIENSRLACVSKNCAEALGLVGPSAGGVPCRKGWFMEGKPGGLPFHASAGLVQW